MSCKTQMRFTASRRRGIAAVLALVVLVVMVVITATMAAQGFMEFRKSDSLSRSNQARLAAEGGLSYMTEVIRPIRLSYNVDSATYLSEVETALKEQLAGMISHGVSVTQVGQSVMVSEIMLPQGSFQTEFAMDTSTTPPCARMIVTGKCGEFTRRVSVTCATVGKRSAIFDFGVASRGKIIINGSATVQGKNDASEACVLSTREQPVAISAGGHATIGGDLYVTGSDVDYVYLQGNGLSIGGSSDIYKIFRDHVYLGTEEPDFPPIDTEQFIPLATNVIDATTNINGTTTFNNIYVKAGTDPHFPSDTVINGIMYVEAPNHVIFSGTTTINGMVVTEDASTRPIADCTIEFKGSSTAPGVTALPDTEEFAAIKKQTGTVLLAPGFDVSFRGASNSINGLIAADKLAFIGNSNISGAITGSIIGLKDNELSLSGNAEITIARPAETELPAGFHHPYAMVPLASSYSEPVP